MRIEKIAEICHETLRAYSECLGETLLPAWRDTRKWQRESTHASVRIIKMFPETTPEELHVVWSKHKIATGWTYGSIKSEKRKTHPNLVPYASLSIEQRAKDYIFLSLAKELLKTPPPDTEYQKAAKRAAKLIREQKKQIRDLTKMLHGLTELQNETLEVVDSPEVAALRSQLAFVKQYAGKASNVAAKLAQTRRRDGLADDICDALVAAKLNVINQCQAIADKHYLRINGHNPDAPPPNGDYLAQGYGNAALNIAEEIRRLPFE